MKTMTMLMLLITIPTFAHLLTIQIDPQTSHELYQVLDLEEKQYQGITVGGWPSYDKTYETLIACSYSAGPFISHSCTFTLDTHSLQFRDEQTIRFSGQNAADLYRLLLIKEERYQGVTVGGWPKYIKEMNNFSCSYSVGPFPMHSCTFHIQEMN